MANEVGQITIENARIMFRNFAGQEGQYNRAGDRNFVVLIDDPKVERQLKKDGWNVKYLKPRDDEDEQQAYLQVSLRYGKSRNPRVGMINSQGLVDLGEDEVEVLDWVDIKKVDMILNPYEWHVNGETGIKAYLKTLMVTIEEDELELKYSDVPRVSAHDEIEPEF